jgi:hypothetical protein
MLFPFKEMHSEEELQASPSRADGIPEETEIVLLATTVAQIIEITSQHRDRLKPSHGDSEGQLFKPHHHVFATAAALFHRFFLRRSLKRHDRLEVAVACILTASAVTDCVTVRPLSLDERRGSHLVAQLLSRQGHAEEGGGGASGAAASAPVEKPGEAAGGGGGGGGGGSGAPEAPVPYVNRQRLVFEAKERLIAAQRALLFTLEYDVCVEPATFYLGAALAALHEPPEILLLLAKKTMLDALKTTLPLRLPPRVLALGVLQVAHDSAAGDALRRAAAAHGIVFKSPSNWGDVVHEGALPLEAAASVARAITRLHAVMKGFSVAAEGGAAGVPSEPPSAAA